MTSLREALEGLEAEWRNRLSALSREVKPTGIGRLQAACQLRICADELQAALAASGETPAPEAGERECNDPDCGCHGSHHKWPHGGPIRAEAQPAPEGGKVSGGF